MAPQLKKKPAAAPARQGRSRSAPLKRPAAAAAPAISRKPAAQAARVPRELKNLKAFIVNLERRPDRWTRVVEMLRKGTPWLEFEQFKASDGTKNPIPEEEVAKTWNTRCNAQFADFWEWAFDAPGTAKHGTQWKWAADTSDDDGVYRFQENGIEGDIEEWSWIHNVGRNAPASTPVPTTRTGTVETIATGEKFQVRLQFAQQFLDPGQVLTMSGGERGCAHSHLRLWRVAAERPEPTLALEDDVTFEFDRSDPELGKANGKVFTERLALALRHAPADFDVIYLGWSGWRGGNHKTWEKDADSGAVLAKGARKFLRRAEYVWTTVAYVISQAGAQKLLARGLPVNQPVDNYMAWEASQGRLNSYVALDQGDDDGTWAGGIVDQFDFQGDTDITKSDGGHQGHDEKEFLMAEPQ